VQVTSVTDRRLRRTDADRIKVIYDTGVVLQATLHPRGPAGHTLRLLEHDAIEGFISGRIREEYVDVLYRPAVRGENPYLTDEQAQVVLEWLDERMTLVINPSRVIEYPRDPKDEPIVNLALTVRADYIVTRDKDLFDLGKSR
jgi:putative PIN family toxin of toxin-antitoxin system